MTLITDTSFLYALYNENDIRHLDANRFAETTTETMLIPCVALPELTYLFIRDAGYRGVETFYAYFKDMSPQLVWILPEDVYKIHEIIETYASAEFDIVDCCIMALAERLQITRIATFDRRDFSIFRPRHCDFLELLPV
ncbi:MAG: PIN domain-containing protein [Chloroflexota bacterium]|nr:PIN domain-containing protein [Chloroflexota bacterium]MDE2857053.1 PIN domain-containing protein [Chloroflexota bacterium]